MIGQRLRLARTASGLSLRDLASKLDNCVTAQVLSKYERDEMMPVSQVLMGLARVLGVSEEYLLGEQELALDGVEFRKKADMSAKEEAQVEARVLQLLERYLTVEEILGFPIEWGEPREAPYSQQNIGAFPPKKELPNRLERLCYRALAEGAISEPKAAELLGISARELNRRLDEPERASAVRSHAR